MRARQVSCLDEPRTISRATSGERQYPQNIAKQLDGDLTCDYLKPQYRDGDMVLDVECGGNNGLLYMSKLCQGSKGPCILFKDMWLTPNEFQYISGRETAKDWKRSIRHHGKSMKLLLSKGIIAVHPPACDCEGCRISSPVNRGRLAEKRTAANIIDHKPNVQNGRLEIDTSSNNSHDVLNGRMGDSLSTSGCTDYIEEIKALIQNNKQKKRDMDNVMDSNRKLNNAENLEPKKESRLTSIIDQLLINKTKDIHHIDDKNILESSISNSEQHSKSPNSFGPEEVHLGYAPQKYSNPESFESRTIAFNNTEYVKDHEKKTLEVSGTDNCYSDSAHSDITAPDRRKQASCSSTSPESTPRPNDRNLCDLPSSQLEPTGEAQGLRNGFWPKGGDSPVAAPPFDGTRGKQPGGVVALATSQKSAFSTFSAASDMPTDTLVSAVGGEPAIAPVKDERISPDPDSSPSISPHSPSPGRGFPGAIGIGFGLRSPAAFTATSPSLDRFATTALGCGSPAIKQMEMMTRNYSDFMRSLAAKYNTQNSQDSFPFCQTNGLIRTMEGPFPFKTTTPPLLGRSMDLDCNTRKTDNHSSPPVLGDHRIPSYSVSEFSSSQTLLNLVRTASAQSASQLENYLRGATKRSHEGENRADPLDLTVTTTKRPRTESSLQGSKMPSPPVSQDISPSPVVKVESELRNSLELSPNTKGNKTSWQGFINSHGCKSDRNSPKSSTKGRCLSLCTEQSCSTKSKGNEVAQWAVDDVVKFVTSIDSCVEYAEKFREQSIDGASLPLLTEDHLTNYMGMKLGPALKLRSTLARLIGHCVVCMHCVHCHGDEQDRRSDASRSPSVSK